MHEDNSLGSRGIDTAIDFASRLSAFATAAAAAAAKTRVFSLPLGQLMVIARLSPA